MSTSGSATQLGTVLVTTPSFGAASRAPWDALAEERLAARSSTDRHPLAAADLAGLVGTVGAAAALIVGLDRVDGTVLDAAPALRVVAKHGVGVDNIDLGAAARRGITVVNAPGTNTGAVADLALGLLLATARRIVEAHAGTAAGGWERRFGPELAGRTLGIIGFGRIGRAVARRARGFDMHVVGHDPFAPPASFAEAGVPSLPFDECLRRADALTLHLPGGSATPLLGAAELAAMKPGALLVNTARGELVDEQALADALRRGHLAGAGLDVFATEPLPADSPLRRAPNTVLTPHIAAMSTDANAAMGTSVVRDIARVLRNQPPLHPAS